MHRLQETHRLQTLHEMHRLQEMHRLHGLHEMHRLQEMHRLHGLQDRDEATQILHDCTRPCSPMVPKTPPTVPHSPPMPLHWHLSMQAHMSASHSGG